jgi:hypothetical protein
MKEPSRPGGLKLETQNQRCRLLTDKMQLAFPFKASGEVSIAETRSFVESLGYSKGKPVLFEPSPAFGR